MRNSTLVKKCSFYIVRLKNSALILEFVTCGVELLTLLTLLRILFLGRIGSISYVLPIRQNIDILNRDIRVKLHHSGYAKVPIIRTGMYASSAVRSYSDVSVKNIDILPNRQYIANIANSAQERYS